MNDAWALLRLVSVAGGTVLSLLSMGLALPGSAQQLSASSETHTDLSTRTDNFLPEQSLLSASDFSQLPAANRNSVESVSQFRDVAPTDWAYEALQTLVNRYGCLVGYPNRSFQGQRSLSRYEFTAGLSGCLDAMSVLIIEGQRVLQEDILTLQRLTEAFSAELANLGSRVDSLEGRVTFLEDHQFSTTTKLKGEVIFALAQAFGDDQAVDFEVPNSNDIDIDALEILASGNDLMAEVARESLDAIDDGKVPVLPGSGGPDGVDEGLSSITTFSDRVRFNLDASFTGRDRLRVRLQTGNSPRFDRVTNSRATRLGFENADNNNIEISRIFYTAPLGDRASFFVAANGIDTHNLVKSVANPFFRSRGTGALSRFARRNPTVYRLSIDQGLSFNFEATGALSFDIFYGVDSGNDPAPKNGLFNGDFATGAQVNWEPTEDLEFGLTYLYSFQPSQDVNLGGRTSSDLAEIPFGESPTRAHRLGTQGSWRISDSINVAGWLGWAFASP
ncbi:MAG: iron uptake porin, partial [Cyanobacteria bacterium P01_H01_bin.15]